MVPFGIIHGTFFKVGIIHVTNPSKGYNMNRKLTVVDTTTGEQLDGVNVWVAGQRRPTIYGDRWLQMSQDQIRLLAKDRELWGRNRAVLDYLISILNFDNFIEVRHQVIADELGLYRPAVTRAINLLIRKNILIKNPTGHTGSYRLNPNFGWKGDNKKAQEYQLELIKGGKTNNE